MIYKIIYLRKKIFFNNKYCRMYANVTSFAYGLLLVLKIYSICNVNYSICKKCINSRLAKKLQLTY